MSDRSLQQQIEFIKYADQQKRLTGRICCSDLPRLSEMLAESSTGAVPFVDVDLQFDRDDQNLRIVRGRVVCDVELICQRCLKNVVTNLDVSFVLAGVFSDEQAANLPRDYEPVLLDNGLVCVSDMIEEELILALPMFAYHSNADCNEGISVADAVAPERDLTKPESPFVVLSGFKCQK